MGDPDALQVDIDNLNKAGDFGYNKRFWALSGASNVEDWFNWYNDSRWDTVLHNTKLLVHFIMNATTAGGLVVDPEVYCGDQAPCALFRYATAKQVVDKSYSDYCDQVRKRGRQFMEAIVEQLQTDQKIMLSSGAVPVVGNDSLVDYPDFSILWYWAYSQCFLEVTIYGLNLETSSYGLMPPFMDGMLEAVPDRMKFRLIEGYEHTYGARNVSYYWDGWLDIKRRQRDELSKVPDLYDRYVRAGFGIFFDGNDAYHWDYSNISNNYYSPQEMYDIIVDSMKIADSDGIVWVWTKNAKFLPQTDSNIPQSYRDAIQRALEDVCPSYDLPWLSHNTLD